METREIADLSSYLQRYDYTANLAPRDWAYEYLRRVPEFEDAAWKAQAGAVSEKTACHEITVIKMRYPQPDAERWGLKFFPNPEIPAPKAHVFWTDKAYGDKVRINVMDAGPGEVDTTFEETIRKCRMAHLTDIDGCEHLVINGNGCSVQVICEGRSLVTADPVKTVFTVDGFEDFEHNTRILKESKRVYGDQSKEPLIFSRKAEMRRNGLIALDGMRAGLSDRQIAWIINGQDLVEAGVAKGDRSLVKRVRTYRENALALCDGGYRELLFGDTTFARME